MFYIASTRFNKSTYNENMNYRRLNKENVIYGTCIPIQEKYPSNVLMFVAEMNNEENKIEGIGLIRNSLAIDKRHRIYKNNDYNAYIYKGTYWVSRENIQRLDPEILEILDNVLFKGKSHVKRQAGITALTEKLFTNWVFELSTLKEKIRRLFVSIYKDKIIDNSINQIEGNGNEEIDGEEKFQIIPIKKQKLKVK
jgi:hypothetical protein